MLNEILKISRSSEIKNDLDQAILWLYSLNFEASNLIMVNYFVDGPGSNVDAVLALGLKTGTGKDSFKVISVSKNVLIWGVCFTDNELPDVSQLDHGEEYLFNNPADKQWYIVRKVGDERQITPITTDPKTFINLEDGTFWVSNERRQVARINDLIDGGGGGGGSTDIIQDSIISGDTTWSSEKINTDYYNKTELYSKNELTPIYNWAMNQIESEIIGKYAITTSASNSSYFFDTTTETTMTVTVYTRFNNNLVDSTQDGTWNKTSGTTGTYTKQITGGAGTSIASSTFTYTYDNIPISKQSDQKTITTKYPAYWGLINTNTNPTAEISSQIMSSLSRVTANINDTNTRTISNNSAETKYLWILTKNTAEATQFGVSMLGNYVDGKEFDSTMNNSIRMTGYKLYISINPVGPGLSYTDVILKINL